MVADRLLPGASPRDGSVGKGLPPPFLRSVREDAGAFQRGSRRLIVEHLDRLRDGGTGVPPVLAVLVRCAHGVLHRTGPSHGKTVVRSHFLARQARPRDGFLVRVQIGLVP